VSHSSHNKSPLQTALSIALTLALVFPLTPNSIRPIKEQDKLSPPTTIHPGGMTEAQRKAIFETIDEKADVVRQNVDINIFQGYDVRGLALDHDGDKANLRPEEAFLIAEAIAHTYKKAMNKASQDHLRATFGLIGRGSAIKRANRIAERTPKILITGDHRETTQALIWAAGIGASVQGFEVYYDSGQVPTGALNFYGLRENYDVIIQVTGSHNPYYNNGMKISVRQQADGFFNPTGKLGALYGNQGKRPFELKSIFDIIREKGDEIRNERREGELTDIHGKPLDVSGSLLAKFPNRPNYGQVVQEYVDALKARFPKLQHPRKLVIDPGNGMGSAAIPVLEHQGHTIVEGLYIDVKPRPDHPADPSKDTAGTAPLEKSGCRACVEAIKRVNQELEEWELPAIGVLTDGDGDRSGLVDEDGTVIRPPAIATLIYRRFILENKETLAKLEKLGKPIKLALDVRSSSVMEKITGVVNPEGELLKEGIYSGIRGIYISAGYPSHRDHVADEIANLRKLQEEIRSGEHKEQLGEDVSLANEIDLIIHSFVSAEASGHYFAATDKTHPETMIDDGVFYAARVLEILDTWNDFEAKDRNIYKEDDPDLKEAYLLKDIFSQKSIPVLPSPDEPRFKGHKSIDDRYAFVRARQTELLAELKKPENGSDKIFRGNISTLVTMEQVTDGVRIMFEDDSAFLIRTSNTSPKYTSMIEGSTWARVVEILEDAIAWLEPHEGDQFSIADLRDRLETAKAKAALENATAAIVGDLGITPEEISNAAAQAELAKFQASLPEAAQTEERMMGWLHADEQDLTQIKEVATDLRENFDDVIVIGIGGSSMGFKALHQALNNNIEVDLYNSRPQETRGRDGKKAPRIHVLEATRADHLRILDRIDLNKTAVIVISKSGGTPEPKFNTEVVLNKFKAKGITGEQLAKQFVLVTGLDQEKGELPTSKLRQRFGSLSDDGAWLDTARAVFPVPNSFGGRYSVFSPVGLLPAAVAGIDIDQMMEGVKEARENSEKPYSHPTNIGFQLPLLLYLLDSLKGIDNFYFFYFNEALIGLGRWLEQLVQESLGDTIETEAGLIRTGPNIKPTRSTEDNHSFVQDFQDGKRNKVGIFIEETPSEEQIEQERQVGLHDEQGLTPSQSLLASLRGTRNATTKNGIPNITLPLQLNEKELAALMYNFEVMTMVYGHLLKLGHKTFTQGGVEGYKEGTREELEAMMARGEIRLPDKSI